MAEKIPPRFRKTKTDKWAIMAPVEDLEKALAEGGKIDVQRKSGDWSTFTVGSLGRPFDVDGVEMCYGYAPEDSEGADSGESSDRSAGGGGGNAPSRRPAASRAAGPSPHRDPTEPLPEYQGGPEDEWDGF